MSARTVAFRVLAGALLLTLALVGGLSARTLTRVPDTLLYFVREDGPAFTLESVGRTLGRAGREAHLRETVLALLAGPTDAERARGLVSTLPPETRLRSLELQGDVVYLDLSREVAAGGGTAMMLGRLNQLFYTLTQPAYVSAVSLAVEGRPVTVFGGEGLIIDNPWQRGERALPRW